MQVGCGNQKRLIRSRVLDKDWFDPDPKTPQHTSWTMQLLERFDQNLGPGVMEKPVFPTDDKPAPIPEKSATLEDISLGKYDAIFAGTPHKPSDLYRLAQYLFLWPDIQVHTDSQIPPLKLVNPIYPPLPRMAKIEGIVTADFMVDSEGNTMSPNIESGHPMLRAAVLDAISKWKFPKEAVNQKVQVSIQFRANCASPQ